MGRRNQKGQPISEQKWAELFRIEARSKQNGRCKYCTEPISLKKTTADHRVPRKGGGSTHRENIAAACAPCNNAKGSMSEPEFIRIIDRRLMPEGYPIAVVLVWSVRRIWKKVDAARLRIERGAR